MNEQLEGGERDDVQMLISLGLKHAAFAGLDYDCAQDCASIFAEKVLHERAKEATGGDRWHDTELLNACARHVALDVRRSTLFAARRTVRLDDVSAILFPNRGVARDGPEELTIWQANYETICAEIDLLDKSERDLLIRHHLNDEPIAAIAASLSATPRSISQRLYRIRRKHHVRLNDILDGI